MKKRGLVMEPAAVQKFLCLVGGNRNNHSGWSALGHEIHLSRFLLLDMLNRNYIDKEDIIVTSNKDRVFLYSSLFRNIITYDEFTNIKSELDDKNIINLWHFNTSLNQDITEHDIHEFESKLDYPIRSKIYDSFDYNFDDLISTIDYPPIPSALTPSKPFVMIHYRNILGGSDGNNGNDIQKNNHCLELILRKLKDKYPHLEIYIFSTKPILFDFFNKYQEENKNITTVEVLSHYASLMNHHHCVALISELSGGGELSQYCHNKKIFIYGNNYSIKDNIHDKIENIQQLINLRRGVKFHDNWNNHITTKALSNRYINVTDLLDNLDI